MGVVSIIIIIIIITHITKGPNKSDDHLGVQAVETETGANDRVPSPKRFCLGSVYCWALPILDTLYGWSGTLLSRAGRIL